MRKLFGILFLLACATSLHAQTIAGTLTVQGSTLNCSSLTGRNTSAISIAVNNSQTNVTLVLSGTWVGTVTFYGTTNNGIQWSALSVTPTGGGSPVTSSTTNGSWGASVSTNTNFCAVSTAFTSGQIFANATLTTTGGGGSGTVSGQTAGYLPLATGATTIGASSLCDYSVSTTNWLTCTLTGNGLAIKGQVTATEGLVAANDFVHSGNGNFVCNGAPATVGLGMGWEGYVGSCTPGNFDLPQTLPGATSYMQFAAGGAGHAVATLVGVTGSGSVVQATGPTLVTPHLGVADATSMASGTSPPTCTPGTAGAYCYKEGTAPTGEAGADHIYGDSTAHQLKMINNNGSADLVGDAIVQYCGATSGGTQNCAKTREINPFIIFGDVTLNTATTQSITTLPFSGAADYSCTGSDLTTAAGIVSFNTYATSSVTIQENGGTNTDHLRYVCVGF